MLTPAISNDPVAQGAAHHQLEVAAFEPRHLLGEHRRALPPGTGHSRDVGAPEAALRPEGLDDLLRVLVDVSIGVGLAHLTAAFGCFAKASKAVWLPCAASSLPSRARAQWSISNFKPGCRSAIRPTCGR